jgi:hypothetical protein
MPKAVVEMVEGSLAVFCVSFLGGSDAAWMLRIAPPIGPTSHTIHQYFDTQKTRAAGIRIA